MKSHSVCAFQVAHFCIVLVSKDFHPEKYSALSRLFSHVYDATGDPTQLLQRYLKIITSGKCNSNSNGSFNVRDFNSNNVHHASILKGKWLEVYVFSLPSTVAYCAVVNQSCNCYVNAAASSRYPGQFSVQHLKFLLVFKPFLCETNYWTKI